MKPFLTANWTNLINITYAIPPELLFPYLPEGVEPDVIDGKAFVSLVPFDFTETRLMGMKIPFHVNFPEINFRFYVTHNGKRGVVFIREFVSKFFISNIANIFYHENYKWCDLESKVRFSDNGICVQHKLNAGRKQHIVKVIANDQCRLPENGSMEHFFEERFYGYSSDRKRNALEFRVEHESWELFPVIDYTCEFDFGKLIGKEWGFLNKQHPICVMLIKGSAVRMFPHKRVKEKEEVREGAKLALQQ